MRWLLLLQPTMAWGWSVLVLGGTGFRGYYTTERLIQEGHEVTVLSRGNSYWGNMEQLRDRMEHWRCNRTLSLDHGGGVQPDSSGLALCTALTSSTHVFDAVVDFSSSTSHELKQAVKLLKDRVKFYVFLSNHLVYEVSKNSTHGLGVLLESDAARLGREASPLDRYSLKGKNEVGDNMLECEEELKKQYDQGGFPYVVFRLANVVGPKENTIRYWLLHLWVRAHIALTLPLHINPEIKDTPISLTYTPDIAQAVVAAMEMNKNETCCPEKVTAEAYNLACEEAPTQKLLYNYIAEPIGLAYVETQLQGPNATLILYPDNYRGPVSVQKAIETLRWSPTSLEKALRSVARFYERVMLTQTRYKREREVMYAKCKSMLAKEGPRFTEWIRAYYLDKSKTELYDDLDDEDEDEIIMAINPKKKRPKKKPRKRSATAEL